MANVTLSVSAALDPAFRYFASAEGSKPAAGTLMGELFAEHEAAACGLSKEQARSPELPPPAPGAEAGGAAAPAPPAPPAAAKPSSGASKFFSSLKAKVMGGGDKKKGAKGAKGGGAGAGGAKGGGAGVAAQEYAKLTIHDFDLLRVVGKGAFGKVMLVRKKAEPYAGDIFAMKVLKKSVVAAKGQVEHTRSERAILCEIRHPYIVQARLSRLAASRATRARARQIKRERERERQRDRDRERRGLHSKVILIATTTSDLSGVMLHLWMSLRARERVCETAAPTCR